MNYGAGAESLLQDFAKAEGSPLIPKSEATAGAEATKKAIEAQSEQAKQDAARAKAEADQKAKEAEDAKKKEGGGTRGTTQESAETLLAQLNTNMSQLIRISQEQKDIGERQLTVQRSLTKDLYAAV